MKKYSPEVIEKKWQKYWVKNQTFVTPEKSDKPKYYVLDMFPYPSGAGLHVGHPKGYIATDVVARLKMMQGYNVLHPMGWDAFGLPAENYALKNKVHPAEATATNIETFKKQLALLGFTYDWNREVTTTDPAYYKWTQWAFLQMFKHGMAFESHEPIIWCPTCKTGLAQEDLENGKCERCGSAVERKPLRQWVLRITNYADRLLNDLDKLSEWPRPIVEMQRNWIGRSEGAEIDFAIKGSAEKIKIFTSRPDTLFGVTYLVIAPEHELLGNKDLTIGNRAAVAEYVQKAKAKSDLERTELQKDKTGVELKGVRAVNPMNGEDVPVFVADYVLGSYGTGAIMAVPAHDERDFAFAKKYNLPIKRVVEPKFVSTTGDGAVKPDLPFVKRNAICAIIRNPKDGKYLCVSWKTVLMHGLVTGGIDGEENIVEAALREIREETGYKNIRLVNNPELAINTFFYHRVKKENRWARFHYLFFELENEERDEVSEKEAALHEIVWKSQDELSDFFTVFEGDFIVNYLKNPDYVFTGDGVMGNSGQYDGKDSVEVKKAITEAAGGRMKTNYKLRDWVFSRQRYWGEPIPLIHCDACQNKKYKYLLLHGRTSSSKENFWPWLKVELEKMGHEVVCPDLPGTMKPNVEQQADFVLQNCPIDENTIIVGHSLGGSVALRALEKAKQKVAKLVLLDAVVKPEFNDRRREDVEQSFTWKFDFAKIKKSAHEIIAIADRKYPVITAEQFAIQKKELGARVIYANANESHFTSKEESSVLEFVTESGWVPVPENQLPLELPKVKNYEPTGTGESPLANITEWVNTTCPKCGGAARRETNTMPQWAGSCWYYLRYEDPQNANELVAKDKEKYWNPVDLYVGGAEHATRHLIYARFWHKFLFDIGVVSNDEPFRKLQNVGLILAEDSRKMSKRWGNVINPDDIVATYGADSMRLYEMFMGPFDQAVAWDTKGLVGVRRFLDRVWSLQEKVAEGVRDNSKLTSSLHVTIKKVSEDIQEMRFNTAIAKMMELCNELMKEEKIDKETYKSFVKILSPFAPHMAEELWSILGGAGSIIAEPWPKYDQAKIVASKITLAVQINGKLRDTIEAEPGIDEVRAQKLALESEKVQKHLNGAKPKKIIYVNGKLVSIVV